MELGARICTVHVAASCGSCPLSIHCKAYAMSQQEEHCSSSPLDSPAVSVMDYPRKVCLLYLAVKTLHRLLSCP